MKKRYNWVKHFSKESKFSVFNHFANIPPSVTIFAPVILLALSLNKYTMVSAISSAPEKKQKIFNKLGLFH
jgi:hypothetical protein